MALFDGKSLEGWKTVDPTWWTVEEGAITARITPEKPCTVNQYLVWAGEELGDFELKLRSRLQGEGAINNGFQFRSRVLPDGDVCGYQMDNNLQTPWLVRLYDEYGRHTLAWRGERAVFSATGERTVSSLPDAPPQAWFTLEDWHEYHLICVGPKLTLRVDGKLAAEVEDHDPRRFEATGALALQLHSGPPTVVQFKDIRLKKLSREGEDKSAPFAAPSPVVAQLKREARAWWDLDVGGHGAKPPLQHFPGFEKFELNVQPMGPGGREGAKAVWLEGAHFEAGADLPGGDTAVTVYLRARDPLGRWQAALLGKGKGDTREFTLSGGEGVGEEKPRIRFALWTSEGPVEIEAALPEPDAWHDLVVRYDGKTVALFVDGRCVATRAWTGSLVRTEAPLVLAAEKVAGEVRRHFHGEMETAALWDRALTDAEIARLTTEAWVTPPAQ